MAQREMTEEEAEALDEYYTKNTVMPDLTKPGYFAGKDLLLGNVESKTFHYLQAQSHATNRTPAQIIDDLVSRELAAAM